MPLKLKYISGTIAPDNYHQTSIMSLWTTANAILLSSSQLSPANKREKILTMMLTMESMQLLREWWQSIELSLFNKRNCSYEP